MGSRFDIKVVAHEPAVGQAYIDTAVAEITRIERLISSWDSLSQTSLINRNAGISPVRVDPELFALIERALLLSRLTDGAFDISYASMDRIWVFDGSMTAMPAPEEVASSVALIGYENIILDKERQTVFLARPGMKIGFGAIGKGYAADKARRLLESKGVTGGIINASGDMTVWGQRPDHEGEWTVAIVNPLNKDKVFAVLPIREGAVVTSGDYEKFVTFEGIRYSHIIDPRTGYPATGILSTSVFAGSAEMADAMATSVFVMGIETGLDFIEQLPGVECIIVDEEGNVHTTSHIKIEKQ